jgi:hypothetical protein
MDMSFRPNFWRGRILPSAVPSGPSLMPNIMPMLGPYRSASSRPTLRPFFARAQARLAATVLLPTPPLPLPTMMQRLTFWSRFLYCASGVGSHWKRISTEAALAWTTRSESASRMEASRSL